MSHDAWVTVRGRHSAPSATLDDPGGAEIAGYRLYEAKKGGRNRVCQA